MKTSVLAAIICASAIVFIACAPVQIYSNKGLTEKSGLKYYTVKPFLHVEREPETNRIVKATIIYLPDLANPQYMVIRDGFNSRKVSLKFTDGSINTFGYTSTSKVGESVDALASALAKSTETITDMTAIKNLPAAKASVNTVELYEIIFGNEKTTLRKVDIGTE
jgi:hypothetical protein